jgi:decaprenylphospho-beta-D-ribofuranose 2-oxidase
VTADSTTSARALTGWGRTHAGVAHVSHERSAQAVAATVAVTVAATLAEETCVTGAGMSTRPRGILARGLGRSYGDAAVTSGGRVVVTDRLRGIGAVDPDTGEIDVGAGTSVGELLEHCVPQGWFVPVTPGTRHVTLGGAVAADVHGKNHHRDGTLGAHVVEVDLVDGLGQRRTVRRDDPLMLAVLGSMGLTGIITRVRIALRPIETASVTVETHRTDDLDATMAVLADDDTHHRHTVAWVDCLVRGHRLGRGVVTSGDHTPGDVDARALPLLEYATARAVPSPSWVPDRLLAPGAMRLFNEAYFRRAPAHRAGEQQTVGAFFHPLDAVAGWNRLYGRRGFLQHQLTVSDPEVVRRVLMLFQRAGAPAYLAVLKRFGPQSAAPLSFPQAGWTLAVDLPAVPAVGPVLDAADELVAAAGGRVYLAKDSRLRAGLLPVMYPALEQWRELREQLDPHRVFVSDLSRRLHL